MASTKNNNKKLFRYRFNEIVCSPKRIRYHMSQTKGIRTELDKGTPLGCRVCTKQDPLPLKQTLYAMERGDGTKFYLCGIHYVEIAQRIQKVEELRAKTSQGKAQSSSVSSNPDNR